MVSKLSDADYLKSKNLGGVIAKGMSAMYDTNPKNPVDFLAKWLLNYSQVERAADERAEALATVDSNIKQHAKAKTQKQQEEAEEQKKKDEKENVKKQFKQKLEFAQDLGDHL